VSMRISTPLKVTFSYPEDFTTTESGSQPHRSAYIFNLLRKARGSV
jgi:hypothetical protein